jgi:SAM-dependent methyltransferase
MERSNLKEFEDNYSGDPSVLNDSIRYFEKANRYLGNNWFIKKYLSGFISSDHVSILDYGTGAGYLPRCLSCWLSNKNISSHILGVDNKPEFIQKAEELSKGFSDIKFTCANSPGSITGKFDVVIVSQMIHHLAPEEAANFFKQLHHIAGKGIIISDLIRSRPVYWMVKGIVYASTSNPINRNDGPLSVLRAYTDVEMKEILGKAGITKYRIYNRFPRKFVIIQK